MPAAIPEAFIQSKYIESAMIKTSQGGFVGGVVKEDVFHSLSSKINRQNLHVAKWIHI